VIRDKVLYVYKHAYIPLTVYPRRGSGDIFGLSSKPSTFYYDLLMRNTVDVICVKPVTTWLQSISGGSAVNPLVGFYDIHGRKGEVIFFCSVADTTRFCYCFVKCSAQRVRLITKKTLKPKQSGYKGKKTTILISVQFQPTLKKCSFRTRRRV
jgi:hypothetical protein